MPHQCIKCNKIYQDGSQELLKGCGGCGGKFFFYIKSDKLEEVREKVEELSKEEKEQIEKDVREIISEKVEEEVPVILDLESVRVLRPGKFELDLRHLFGGEPLVYKMADGKYIIDVASSFQMKKKKAS